MLMEVDPTILSTVQTVYTTDLELPKDWTDAQRAEFIESEADKITWMVRARAGTLGDQRVEQWTCTHDRSPDPIVQSALRVAARSDALRSVLHTELFELITSGDHY